MDSGAKRHATANYLGCPPHPPHPFMFAGHHAMTEIVHDRRAYLRGCVDGVGMGKRAHKRIAFRTITARDCPASCIGVINSGSVSGGHQAIPDPQLAGSFIVAARRRFHGRA